MDFNKYLKKANTQDMIDLKTILNIPDLRHKYEYIYFFR